MITKVKLKNWRSHLESEFNFSTGTNALLGHMGAGKTSILDSVCFGLFGTFPSLQNRKLKLDDVIMKKPVEKDRAEVEVQFQLNNSNYFVKRVIEKGRGTTHSEIKENGRLLESPSTSRVTEIVEKILKINYELFSRAVYSEQNALDYFLTMGKGQRMKKIDELLMIDKFEKARANAVSLANKLVERKLGKQSIAEQTDLNALQKNVTELKNSLDAILSEKQLLQNNLEEVLVKKSETEKEFTGLQKIRDGLELLKREERGIGAALQETIVFVEKLESSLKSFDRDSIEKNLKEFSRISRELEDMFAEKEKNYQRIQEQAAKAKAEVELIRKEKLDKLEKQLDEKLRIKGEFDRLKKEIGKDVEKQLNEKRKLFEKFVGEVELVKNKIKDLTETVSQLSTLVGRCPICESRLTKEKKVMLIKQKQTQIKALMESFGKAKKNKQLSEKDLRDLEIAANKLDKLVIEMKDFEEIKFDLENTRNIYSVLNESAVKLAAELNAVRKEIEGLYRKSKDVLDKKQKFELLLSHYRDYEERKNRFLELSKQRESIVKHIAELERQISGKDLAVVEKWLRNLIAKEKEISTKLLGIDQIAKEKAIRLRDFENAFAVASKAREEIKKLDKLIQELRIFEKALQQTQIQLRSEFITSVNYTMNNLWQTLYPYQDFSSIKLAVEEGDYVLQLQERSGRWVNVEGIASGGERSIAALALRIAFALVLAPQLRWLILDEPTHNLDAKSVEDLAETLRERIGEFVDQVFLITHDEKLEDAVTGNSYRLERDKAADGATKVLALH